MATTNVEATPGHDRSPSRRAVRSGLGVLTVLATLLFTATVVRADVTLDDNLIINNEDIGGTIQTGDRLAAALTFGDFNGDGVTDIALGIPSDGSVGGSVRTILGSASGPDLSTSTFFSQGTLFGDDFAEAGDGFGYAVASGDFDGDGYEDLAVGVPFEDLPEGDDAGTVDVVYGSATGLDETRTSSFSQAGAIRGIVEPGDQFGYSLATGDFNADGFADLAVGVWSEGIAGNADAGAVNVIYGSDTGLIEGGNEIFSQRGAVAGGPEDGDGFGYALAAGDFDGDGDDDLAVGVPFEDLGGGADAGAVNILGGSTEAGLRIAGNYMVNQNGPLPGADEADDRFGQALVAADFNGDGFVDLAVGVPGEGIGGDADAGAVNILYGSVSSLQEDTGQIFSQAGPIGGAPEPDDRFGSSLAADDLSGDGIADLVVGAPGEGIGADDGAGALVIVNTGPTGVDETDNEFHSQKGRIGGAPEPGDHFAEALGVADVNGDGAMDLIVGTPDEDLGTVENSGLLHVLWGG